MLEKRIYDVVVYGATGFTGQLVVEYLAKNYANSDELVWAMAGELIERLSKNAGMTFTMEKG